MDGGIKVKAGIYFYFYVRSCEDSQWISSSLLRLLINYQKTHGFVLLKTVKVDGRFDLSVEFSVQRSSEIKLSDIV